MRESPRRPPCISPHGALGGNPGAVLIMVVDTLSGVGLVLQICAVHVPAVQSTFGTPPWPRSADSSLGRSRPRCSWSRNWGRWRFACAATRCRERLATLQSPPFGRDNQEKVPPGGDVPTGIQRWPVTHKTDVITGSQARLLIAAFLR